VINDGDGKVGADELEAELLVQGGVGCHRLGYQQQRVAVRGRAYDYLDPDIGAGAGPVLNDEGLSEPLCQPLTYQARKDVEGSAGRDRHDDTHRPGGIDLRSCNSRDHWQRGSTRGQMQEFAAGKFHHVSSLNANDEPDYSPLMFAALIIGHHFSVSALWKA